MAYNTISLIIQKDAIHLANYLSVFEENRYFQNISKKLFYHAYEYCLYLLSYALRKNDIDNWEEIIDEIHVLLKRAKKVTVGDARSLDPEYAIAYQQELHNKLFAEEIDEDEYTSRVLNYLSLRVPSENSEQGRFSESKRIWVIITSYASEYRSLVDRLGFKVKRTRWQSFQGFCCRLRYKIRGLYKYAP